MVGDRFLRVRVEWREHVGGPRGGSMRRECIGAVEHVADSWILIRRPRGGVVLKRLKGDIVRAGRLAARVQPNGPNLLEQWVADAEAAKSTRRRRAAEAAARRAAERAAWDAECVAAQAADPDWHPW